MTDKYDKCVKQWNDIFSKAVPEVPTSQSIGNETLDKGIEWVCDSTKVFLILVVAMVLCYFYVL